MAITLLRPQNSAQTRRFTYQCTIHIHTRLYEITSTRICTLVTIKASTPNPIALDNLQPWHRKSSTRPWLQFQVQPKPHICTAKHSDIDRNPHGYSLDTSIRLASITSQQTSRSRIGRLLQCSYQRMAVVEGRSRHIYMALFCSGQRAWTQGR